MQIDFEKLLKNYNNELVTKLRGFNDQYDYLQYWVPDSNKTTSLLNLIDALYETGKLNFSMLVLKTDKQLINELTSISRKFGSIKVEEKKKNCKIIFSLDSSKYKTYKERKINLKSSATRNATLKKRKLTAKKTKTIASPKRKK